METELERKINKHIENLQRRGMLWYPPLSKNVRIKSYDNFNGTLKVKLAWGYNLNEEVADYTFNLDNEQEIAVFCNEFEPQRDATGKPLASWLKDQLLPIEKPKGGKREPLMVREVTRKRPDVPQPMKNEEPTKMELQKREPETADQESVNEETETIDAEVVSASSENIMRDLRKSLFKAIEKLTNGTMSAGEAKAMASLGQTIINSSKMELEQSRNANKPAKQKMIDS